MEEIIGYVKDFIYIKKHENYFDGGNNEELREMLLKYKFIKKTTRVIKLNILSSGSYFRVNIRNGKSRIIVGLNIYKGEDKVDIWKGEVVEA